jgi:hypothetical protein
MHAWHPRHMRTPVCRDGLLGLPRSDASSRAAAARAWGHARRGGHAAPLYGRQGQVRPAMTYGASAAAKEKGALAQPAGLPLESRATRATDLAGATGAAGTATAAAEGARLRAGELSQPGTELPGSRKEGGSRADYEGLTSEQALELALAEASKTPLAGIAPRWVRVAALSQTPRLPP